MRFKNFTLLVLVGLLFSFVGNLSAQEDAAIDASQIRYWIGEGVNEAVFIVDWNEPDTALAWGYRFNEEAIMVKDMMENIAAADSRLAFTASGSMVNDITFNDGFLDLSLSGAYWLYNVNGAMAMNYYDAQVVVNGDYVKWGDESCATEVPAGSWNYVWTKDVAAVYPNASDASIAAENVLYWVGEGEHQVVFVVNWNEPNVALAWGYRFNEESIVVKEVMDAIAAADNRFDYQVAGTLVTDLTYNDGELDLSLAGMYWLFNVNGEMAWYGYEEQTVADGDYIKWGDESCGTEIAQWSYVWEQEIVPVTDNTDVNASEESVVSLYPNPAVDETWVSVEGMGETSVLVYDMQGRLVVSQHVNVMGDTKIRIETSSMNSGMYYVEVRNGGISKTLKLMVR